MTGLRKRTAPSRSQKRQQDSAAAWSDAERIVEELEAEGWEFPRRPRYEIPDISDIEIDTISDAVLMRLFRELVAWSGYVQVAATTAKVNVRIGEAKLKRLGAFELIRSWESGKAQASAKQRRVTYDKAKASMSPEVEEAEWALLRMRAVSELQEVLFDDIERKTNFVSRELTRRGQLAPGERRATGLAGA